MKKIFFRMLPVVATGVVLTACNNAEEVQKQKDAEVAKIQALVDEKLAELQTAADAECTALVDSLATAKYDEWVAAESKKKGGVKPKPKPKAPETKKPETKADKMGGNTGTNTAADKASKMGGTTNAPTGGKASKMGGTGN